MDFAGNNSGDFRIKKSIYLEKKLVLSLIFLEHSFSNF
ncbi:hypothetical protein LEP1GSC082_3016 [Leptospira kirschneri str. H2]|nr:hypothetical protein LEP1GSC082_3016 [Leptospira kirschneri str. H2]